MVPVPDATVLIFEPSGDRGFWLRFGGCMASVGLYPISGKWWWTVRPQFGADIDRGIEPDKEQAELAALRCILEFADLSVEERDTLQTDIMARVMTPGQPA